MKSRGAKASKIKKWQMVEGVVHAIESMNHPSIRVVRRAMVPNILDPAPSLAREIDVVIEFEMGGRTYRTGIEVKDEKSPLDLPAVEGLCSKFDDLDLQAKCIVSVSGYSAAAMAKAERHLISCLTIDEIQKANWIGTSEFEFEHRNIELFHVSLDYEHRQDQLEGILSLSPELLIWDEGAKARSRFVDAVLGWCQQSADKLPRNNHVDGAVIKADINVNLPAGSHLVDDGKPYPLPDRVIALYMLNITTQRLPVILFRRSDGHEAATAIAPDGSQITVTRAQMKDHQTISVTVATAAPTKSNIDPHPDRAKRKVDE